MDRPIIRALILVYGALVASGFRGAVYEHARIQNVGHNEPKEIIQANLEYYQVAARAAKAKGAEVIVFPEYGLFPGFDSRAMQRPFLELVPDPKQALVAPCDDQDSFSDRPILLTMSCVARDARMYLVVNMGDIQPCQGEKDCPEDGSFHYNTNAVFDRDGRIIAKYHKEHPFGEFGMDAPPPGKQDPTFQTDLGRFATFVCFDMVFGRIVEVSHWEGVQAVLFPTFWEDSFPLLSAMQYFQAWSIGNGVPVLAANVHRPGTGTIGSGIVGGSEGALVYTFNPDGRSKLLVADLLRPDDRPGIYVVTENGTEEWTQDGRDVKNECSTKVLGPSKDLHKDYRCDERDLANFTLARLTENSGSINLCNNGLCCLLDYSAEEMLENYVLGVGNGSFSSLGRYSWAEENCFLARCDGAGDKSCVTFPTVSETRFDFVSLKANFSTDHVYPSVVTSRMRLPPRQEWKFENRDRAGRVYFQDDAGKEVLVVGLKARAYDRDPPYKQ